jgi:hypothetical protein
MLPMGKSCNMKSRFTNELDFIIAVIRFYRCRIDHSARNIAVEEGGMVASFATGIKH